MKPQNALAILLIGACGVLYAAAQQAPAAPAPTSDPQSQQSQPGLPGQPAAPNPSPTAPLAPVAPAIPPYPNQQGLPPQPTSPAFPAGPAAGTLPSATGTAVQSAPADRALQDRIRGSIMQGSPATGSITDLTLTSRDGRVVVGGRVRSDKDRAAVLDKAKAIAGSKNVVDELTLAP